MPSAPSSRRGTRRPARSRQSWSTCRGIEDDRGGSPRPDRVDGVDCRHHPWAVDRHPGVSLKMNRRGRTRVARKSDLHPRGRSLTIRLELHEVGPGNVDELQPRVEDRGESCQSPLLRLNRPVGDPVGGAVVRLVAAEDDPGRSVDPDGSPVAERPGFFRPLQLEVADTEPPVKRPGLKAGSRARKRPSALIRRDPAAPSPRAVRGSGRTSHLPAGPERRRGRRSPGGPEAPSPGSAWAWRRGEAAGSIQITLFPDSREPTT